MRIEIFLYLIPNPPFIALSSVFLMVTQVTASRIYGGFSLCGCQIESTSLGVLMSTNLKTYFQLSISNFWDK